MAWRSIIPDLIAADPKADVKSAVSFGAFRESARRHGAEDHAAGGRGGA